MLLLLSGLILFLGIHSISIVALPLRERLAAVSEIVWKLFYSVISLLGLYLIIQGYAELKTAATVLYVTPQWTRHLAALLLLPIFILFFAPYFPGKIKYTTRHPQLIAVKLWAVAHLLVNGTVADVLLFGSFLLWAVADRLSMSNRPLRAVPSVIKSKTNDMIVLVLGIAVYLATAFWLHETLIGVRPFN